MEKSHVQIWDYVRCFHVNLMRAARERSYFFARRSLTIVAERDFLRDTPRRDARVFSKLWFPRCSVNTRPRRHAFRALSHASSRWCTGRGIDFNFGSSDFLPLRDILRAHTRVIKVNTVTKRSTANYASCKTTAVVPRKSWKGKKKDCKSRKTRNRSNARQMDFRDRER